MHTGLLSCIVVLLPVIGEFYTNKAGTAGCYFEMDQRRSLPVYLVVDRKAFRSQQFEYLNAHSQYFFAYYLWNKYSCYHYTLVSKYFS